MCLQVVTGGHKIVMVHGTLPPVKARPTVAGATHHRDNAMEVLRDSTLPFRPYSGLWMRYPVLALLAMVAASCSTDPTEPSRRELVMVDGIASLRNGPPLAGMTVSFHRPAAARNALSPLAPKGLGVQATPPLLNYSRTDPQGRFSLRLPEGNYEVWISGPADSGIMSQHVADVALRLPVAALDLHYQGYRVSGRLIGPGNATLDEADLSILSATNTAHATVRSGGYTFLVPIDVFSVWANPTATGYEGGIPRVRFDGISVMSDTTIDLSLDGHLVSGKVTGS